MFLFFILEFVSLIARRLTFFVVILKSSEKKQLKNQNGGATIVNIIAKCISNYKQITIKRLLDFIIHHFNVFLIVKLSNIKQKVGVSVYEQCCRNWFLESFQNDAFVCFKIR